MKNLIFLFIFLASCAPNISRKINQTKSAFGDKCKGVNSLTWQEQVQGADAATTAKLISDLTAAAEADAKKSEGLKGSVKADLNIKSELAKVINRNTTQSSKVSEEFWQQEIRFGESVCLFLSLLDRKDLSTKLKENIINDIRKLVTSYSDYELNRNSNKSQGYLNNSVINNGSQIKEQNTLITIGENNSSNGSTYINNGGIMATGGSSISNASVNVGNLIINPAAQNLKNEEKSQLLSLVKSELSKYGGDLILPLFTLIFLLDTVTQMKYLWPRI